ncbi:MAG: HD domain-containing protein [Candidatus Woesearchaeota archaeon]
MDELLELVDLAEDYCILFHEGQKRKSINKEPYYTHPFAVRDILVKYGYDNGLTQIVALLHDSIEETSIKNEQIIREIFGGDVYQAVFDLSRNTIGRNSNSEEEENMQKVINLYRSLGVEYIYKKRDDLLLTPQAYKLRILAARDTVKRVKIADLIHNTKDLHNLEPKSIIEKINECENFYIPLASLWCPKLVKELSDNVRNYTKSKHYKETINEYNLLNNSDININYERNSNLDNKKENALRQMFGRIFKH